MHYVLVQFIIYYYALCVSAVLFALLLKVIPL